MRDKELIEVLKSIIIINKIETTQVDKKRMRTVNDNYEIDVKKWHPIYGDYVYDIKIVDRDKRTI